jgi:hypothetical protein
VVRRVWTGAVVPRRGSPSRSGCGRKVAPPFLDAAHPPCRSELRARGRDRHRRRRSCRGRPGRGDPWRLLDGRRRPATRRGGSRGPKREQRLATHHLAVPLRRLSRAGRRRASLASSSPPHGSPGAAAAEVTLGPSRLDRKQERRRPGRGQATADGGTPPICSGRSPTAAGTLRRACSRPRARWALSDERQRYAALAKVAPASARPARRRNYAAEADGAQGRRPRSSASWHETSSPGSVRSTGLSNRSAARPWCDLRTRAQDSAHIEAVGPTSTSRSSRSVSREDVLRRPFATRRPRPPRSS